MKKVAAQPNLSDVLKLAILPDLLGVDMAVIVQNGHLGCVIVIQDLCAAYTKILPTIRNVFFVLCDIIRLPPLFSFLSCDVYNL